MRTRHKMFIIVMYGDEEVKCSAVKFVHEGSKSLFDLSEESDGTVRLFDLLEVLLDTRNRTFFIDEFDRSLHPNMTRKFIQMFSDGTKTKNTQLIVTTHDVELMDLNLLRRDEIWFTKRNRNGTTDIFSLDRYQTRFDKDIKSAYLKGVYGGIPSFENYEIKEDKLGDNSKKNKYEYCSRRGPKLFCGYGIDIPDGFMVFKGAKVRKNAIQNIKNEDRKMREKFIEDGTIKNWVLTKDVIFHSKSEAAACIGGTRVDGEKAWRKV